MLARFSWCSMGCHFLKALLSLGAQRAKQQIMGCPFLSPYLLLYAPRKLLNGFQRLPEPKFFLEGSQKVARSLPEAYQKLFTSFQGRHALSFNPATIHGVPFFSLCFGLFFWRSMGCPFLKAFFLLGGFFGFHGVPFRSTARKATNHGVRFFKFRLVFPGVPFFKCASFFRGAARKATNYGVPFFRLWLLHFSWYSMR